MNCIMLFQIKDRDDTISITLRQNDTLQRQAADYKKKVSRRLKLFQGIVVLTASSKFWFYTGLHFAGVPALY